MMNILPRTTKDFASKEYWDQFFKLQEQSFEWYGDYSEIKKILLRYMKPQDDVLIIGCGNSSLSADLYDDGYQSNTSIDISDVVIDKMNSIYKSNNLRENLKFQCMDVFNMSYVDNEFKIVIDKGTLDALSSDNLDLSKMFSELERVVKPLGRYICVTLLQENIVKNLLTWFTKSNSWIIRIHRCLIDQKQDHTDRINFPVFIVVCTKLNANISAKSLVEIDLEGNGNFKKIDNIQEVYQLVKSVQDIEFLKFFIRNNKIKDENFFIELFDGTHCEYRYILYFVQKATISIRRCAAFIVPQGREHEWLFSTAKGRENLLKQCQTDRLIVIILNRKHDYVNMEQIKNELSSQLLDFFPVDNKNYQFLSIGDDIGERNVIFKGKSDFSGEFVVEDVSIDGEKFRRLIFLSNVNVIQSEAKFKTITTKKRTKEVIDNEYLSCSHHRTIAASFVLMNRSDRDAFTMVLIGLGGGCFVNFLSNNLKSSVKLKIIVVEIDQTMLTIAKKFFDFQKFNENKNIKVEVIIDNGLHFLEQSSRDGKKYDFIIFDVDSKNLNLGISCPPKEFVEQSVLEQVNSLLAQNGMFILNLVARNEDMKLCIQDNVRKLFGLCLMSDIEDELNEIIFCFNSEELTLLSMKDFQQRLKFSKKSLFYIDSLSENYSELCKKKSLLL